MNENKKAIVFAGGGSKGAYQLGVWKALEELGETFDIATGTSIGSINAAFYVQKDFEPAAQMWSEITAGDIMANGISFDVSFEGSEIREIELISSPFYAKATTGSIKGVLLTPKIFLTDTSTGSITVPHTTTGGVCDLSTSTGTINISIK